MQSVGKIETLANELKEMISPETAKTLIAAMEQEKWYAVALVVYQRLYERKRAMLREEIEDLYEEYSDGDIEKDEFFEKLIKLVKELEEVQETLWKLYDLDCRFFACEEVSNGIEEETIAWGKPDYRDIHDFTYPLALVVFDEFAERYLKKA